MNKYSIEFDKRRNQFEVWKLNKKGYYNFIQYTDTLAQAKKITGEKAQDKIIIKGVPTKWSPQSL